MIIFNYLLYYLILIPISLLPFPVLYLLSDFTSFILFHIVGYRKKVVMDNLRNSFPEKSVKEIKQIARKFYRHFSDIIVESIKLFTISSVELRKRQFLTNPELPQRLFDEKKSLMLVTGHIGNWEWAGTVTPFFVPYRSMVIYQKLSNRFFNKKIMNTRGRFGLDLVRTKNVKSYFETHKDELIMVVSVSDQSPSSANRSYWTTFLNQPTAVQIGAERNARQSNMAVVYADIKKIKRGYYETTLQLLFENAGQTKVGEITEKFTRIIEEKIREKPEYWLWSHRRWKLKKPIN